jgi:K+/H+ antiporter YhaU regulatory subunit KhtT
VAVKRLRPDGTEGVAVLPDSEYVLQGGDVLLLVGADARIGAFITTG